jgi:hypothetical protein
MDKELIFVLLFFVTTRSLPSQHSQILGWTTIIALGQKYKRLTVPPESV